MNPISHTKPILGVIGGFGPDTSATFSVQLVRHAHAIEPLHPPAFVIDFVSVSPELSAQAINGSREAGEQLVKAVNISIGRLRKTGIQTIALPCNTLHLFVDQFAIPDSLSFLHIVDVILDELKRRRIRKIGLLATQLTIDSGLYAERCEKADVECIAPSASALRNLSQEIGHFVGAGTVTEDTARIFESAFREFRRKGVESVVLGCTDLSGMLERCGAKPELPCVDSMDVLAKACAKRCV